MLDSKKERVQNQAEVINPVSAHQGVTMVLGMTMGHVSERDIHSERHSTVTFKTMRQQGDRVHQWLDDHLFIHILKYVGCWNLVPLLCIFLMLW